MIVSFIWKDCNYQNGSWGAKSVDAFFVGFTPDEAKQHLPDKHFEEKNLSPVNADMGILGGRVYFLIGRDLSFCDLHAWWYPISGQWNGGSPFEAFGDIEISSLKELKKLKLKLRPEKKRQWTKAELIKLATDCKVKVTSRDTRASLLAKIKEAVI